MSERVGVREIEIPGMQIKFTGPIAPDGKGMEWTVAVDRTESTEDLNEMLDRITAAHRRQAAIEELPIVKESLYKNRRLLTEAQRERARAEAQAAARIPPNRRNPQPASPQDESRVLQYDQRILQIQEQILLADARIPYLEAIVAGKEPPEALPELREAAE